MTLNNVIALTSPNRTVISLNWDGLRKVVEDTLILSGADMYAKEFILEIYYLLRYLRRLRRTNVGGRM